MAPSEQNQSLMNAAGRSLTQPFNDVIRVAPKDAAPFLIDGRASPPVILNDDSLDAPVSCTLHGESDVLLRVFTGKRVFDSAFVSGRLAISGDMSVIARLTLSAP